MTCAVCEEPSLQLNLCYVEKQHNLQQSALVAEPSCFKNGEESVSSTRPRCFVVKPRISCYSCALLHLYHITCCDSHPLRARIVEAAPSPGVGCRGRRHVESGACPVITEDLLSQWPIGLVIGPGGVFGFCSHTCLFLTFVYFTSASVLAFKLPRVHRRKLKLIVSLTYVFIIKYRQFTTICFSLQMCLSSRTFWIGLHTMSQVSVLISWCICILFVRFVSFVRCTLTLKWLKEGKLRPAKLFFHTRSRQVKIYEISFLKCCVFTDQILLRFNPLYNL